MLDAQFQINSQPKSSNTKFINEGISGKTGKLKDIYIGINREVNNHLEIQPWRQRVEEVVMN